MNNNSYIIEFTGLAGSGKSYLKGLLNKELETKGIETNNEQLGFLDFFQLRSWVVIYYSLKTIIRSKPKSLRCFLKSFIYWLKVQLVFAKTRMKGGVLLVSEGVVHKVRLLRRNSKYRFMLKDLEKDELNNIVLPNMVVLVNADESDIKQRRLKRDNINLESMREAIKRIELTKTDMAVLETTQNVGCLEFNNHSSAPDKEKLKNLQKLVAETIQGIENAGVI